MIKAALIDIGNVLLHVDFKSSLAPLVPEELADPETRIESLLEKKDDFESGRIPEQEFVEWAMKKLGCQGTKDDFLQAWNSIFEINEPMWETIRDLKGRGLKLILFSNTNQMHADFFLKEYEELFALFDGQIFSHLVGSIKPEPEIYERAFKSYDLKPEETIYIDDLPENITTGLQLGLAAWRYDHQSHGAMTRWLVETLD